MIDLPFVIVSVELQCIAVCRVDHAIALCAERCAGRTDAAQLRPVAASFGRSDRVRGGELGDRQAEVTARITALQQPVSVDQPRLVVVGCMRDREEQQLSALRRIVSHAARIRDRFTPILDCGARRAQQAAAVSWSGVEMRSATFGAMVPEPPVVKLTNAILLSAIKERAQRVRVRPDTAQHCMVELLIDGAYREEMRLPATLLATIVRRFSIMANLPMYPKGGAAEGFIHLRIGDYRAAYFAIVVDGHGDTMRAILEEITEEDYNSAKSSGSTGVYR